MEKYSATSMVQLLLHIWDLICRGRVHLLHTHGHIVSSTIVRSMFMYRAWYMTSSDCSMICNHDTVTCLIKCVLLLDNRLFSILLLLPLISLCASQCSGDHRFFTGEYRFAGAFGTHTAPELERSQKITAR